MASPRKNKQPEPEAPAKGKELKSALDLDRRKSDKVAILFTDILGSPGFLFAFFLVILLYVLWNIGFIPGSKPFDKYPFSALDMVLSVFAVMLTVTVLISQNRQRRIEKIREEIEFEVNVRAETEITKMLTMLHDIQHKLGINKPDKELDEMKETLDLQQLHEKVGRDNDKI